MQGTESGQETIASKWSFSTLVQLWLRGNDNDNEHTDSLSPHMQSVFTSYRNKIAHNTCIRCGLMHIWKKKKGEDLKILWKRASQTNCIPPLPWGRWWEDNICPRETEVSHLWWPDNTFQNLRQKKSQSNCKSQDRTRNIFWFQFLIQGLRTKRCIVVLLQLTKELRAGKTSVFAGFPSHCVK